VFAAGGGSGVRPRRLGAALLIWVAVLAWQAASADAQCGETTNVMPRHSLGLGAPPLAIGDSVLYDAADTLANYGFETNAMVCRTMAQGITWLQEHQHSLPVLVVVALGTNGSVSDSQIDELLSILGPNRLLAMVTPHNGNYAYVPGLIRSAARQHPGRIVVLDWDRLSARHPDWFAPDGIHLGSAAGINAFAQLVASSLLATPTQLPAPAAASTTPAPPPAPPKPPKPPTPKPAPAAPRPPQTSAVVTRATGIAWVVVSAVEAVGLALVGG
jgi:cell division septation protein DedD